MSLKLFQEIKKTLYFSISTIKKIIYEYIQIYIEITSILISALQSIDLIYFHRKHFAKDSISLKPFQLFEKKNKFLKKLNRS